MSTGDLPARSRQLWSTKVDAAHRHRDEVSLARYAGELQALLPAGGVLFDVGCGSCQVTTYLAPVYDRVLAFDFSESMLAAGRARVAHLGLTNVDVTAGEATRFPPAADHADAILVYGVIQYLDETALEAHLSECLRVLAPGGTILWGLVPNAHLRWLWYTGALSNPRPAFGERLRRHWRAARRAATAWRHANPLGDEIGRWFTQAELRRLAEAHGLEIEFRYSWFYEYRYHALLRRPA